MKISELNFSEIKQGMQFKGLKTPEKIGTVIFIDYMNDSAVHYKWDDEEFIGTWFGVDCECEVVQDEEGKIVVDLKKISKEHKNLQRNAQQALLNYFTKAKTNSRNKLYNLKPPINEEDKISCIIDKMMEVA